MTDDVSHRASALADLHSDGCLLLPNAWDAGSARLLAAAGFPALATTSAGVAFSHGRPDHDFLAGRGAGARLGRATMMRRVGEIADAVRVPVSADLEEGYGAEPEVVAETVALAVAAGAAGGNIEDFTGDPAGPLVGRDLAVDRIAAARAAAARPFVLVGRTDALLVGRPVAEAVDRANAYLAAGADCAFVPGASDAATIGLLVRELAGPLNVVMGLTGGTLTMAELADLGVRRVTVGGSLVRAMYGHLRRAADELRRGTFTYAADQISQDELNDVFRPATG